jgi:hypothetical protein
LALCGFGVLEEVDGLRTLAIFCRTKIDFTRPQKIIGLLALVRKRRFNPTFCCAC